MVTRWVERVRDLMQAPDGSWEAVTAGTGPSVSATMLVEAER